MNTAEEALKTAQPPASPSMPLIRSITIDTVSAIQKNDIYEMWDDGKAIKHDKWRDLGVELVQFAKELTDLGITLVGVVGYPGTGKSYGMKGLKPGTNIWYNCDAKMCTYKGGKAEYGTLEAPTRFHKQPKTYASILEHVKLVKEKNLFAANPIAFLVGHVDDYRSGETYKQRLKTFGNIARASLEDMLAMCYYSEAIPTGTGVSFKLRTQNNGINTGRSLEGQHEGLYIDNNYQTIIDSFDNY